MTLTMFYDSTCILCRSEAVSLRELGKGRIKIISVIDGQNELNNANISYQEAMTHLCVQDEFGHWHKAMNAVRILYQVADIKFCRISAYRIFNLPILKHIFDIGYQYFAKHRHLMPKFLVKLYYGVVYDVHLNALCDNNCYYIKG